MVVLLAALILAQNPPPPGKDDAAEIREIVGTFFAAANRRDAKAALAVWNATDADAAVLTAAIRDHRDKLTDVALGPVLRRDKHAVATIRFKGKLLPQDALYPDETVNFWRAVFVREEAGWKWLGAIPGAADLAGELLRMPEPAARRALLELRRDEVGQRLIATICDLGERLDGDAKRDRRAIYAVALQAADFSGRADLQGLTRFSRGVMLQTYGRRGEALADLEKAVELGTTDLEWMSRAHSFFAMALADDRQFKRARREAALALVQAREDGALFLSHQMSGYVSSLAGEPKRALTEFQAAQKVALRMMDDDALCQALTEMARVLNDLGEYQRSLEASVEGLKHVVSDAQAVSRAKLYNNMGLVYHATGKLDAARGKFDEALEVTTKWGLHRLSGGVRNNLAQTYQAENEHPKAAEHLRKAIEILEADDDLYMAALAHNNLGTELHAMGDRPGATAEFQRCREQARKAMSISGEIISTINLSNQFALDDRHDDALAEAEAALKLASDRGTPPLRMHALVAVAQARKLRGGPGDLDEAIRAMRSAVGLVEQSRSSLRDPFLSQGFFSLHAGVYWHLADALRRTGRTLEAFTVSEEAKARTLIDLLQNGNVRVDRAMTDEERADERRLEAALDGAEREAAEATQTDEVRAAQIKLGKARETLEEFRRAALARHPELAAARARVAPATANEIFQRLIPQGSKTVLYSYLVGSRGIQVYRMWWAGKKPQLSTAYVQMPIEELTKKVETMAAACASTTGDYKTIAQQLYKDLLDPGDDVEHLVLIPDRVLHGLPFAALIDDQGRHLIERCTVRVAPSATALVKMDEIAERRRATPSKVAMLAVGAPVMPLDFAPLPFAEADAKGAAARFGVEPLLGADATESTVRQRIGAARRVHVATHGAVNEESPFYSYIVLGRDAANDGLLQAREIVDLDLAAELVVLSACETGKGKQLRGEGVLGLTWALFAAGAPATVLSQWTVSDEGTTELMQGFYVALAPGVPFEQALASAQRAAMKKRAHPYYWAPFMLIGSGRG